MSLNANSPVVAAVAVGQAQVPDGRDKMVEMQEVELETPQVQAADSSEAVAPPGFVIHRESTTSILFAAPAPGTAPVFLNPVQEYNRDLSVVAIRTWSERRQREKIAHWETALAKKRERRKARAGKEQGPGEPTGEDVEGNMDAPAGKKRKAENGQAVAVLNENTQTAPVEQANNPARRDEPPTYKFTLLEALSATGLRAIRYAKEIPLLRYVVANDLSASAVEDIRRNVEFNGLSPPGLPSENDGETKLTKAQIEEATLGRVRVNEGDAVLKMYMHRGEKDRFDCIDLDPYGSAVPFLDAAIGAVADGGLICVTCTDVGVMIGHNYPEKCYTHYGGVCVNAEYCHEVGLRLVLNALATTAARYGRHIEPLLSLSIDFYVRLFIRVATSPKEVKALPTKTSIVFYCVDCQTPHFQPLGRSSEKVSAKSGQSNVSYHAPSGPPPGVGGRCERCNGKFHIGGPMWNGPLHNKEFVAEMLAHVAEHPKEFSTAARIEGMLTVAHNELEAPLYFTPTRIAGTFNCTSPPLNIVASALLNKGYQVSRSHACPGSLKTDAPRTFVHDIMREWIKTHPVTTKNIKDGSPSKRLLDQEQTETVDLTLHRDVGKVLLGGVKLVRYQINPQPAWGPARAAVKGAAKKQKKTVEGDEAGEQ